MSLFTVLQTGGEERETSTRVSQTFQKASIIRDLQAGPRAVWTTLFSGDLSLLSDFSLLQFLPGGQKQGTHPSLGLKDALSLLYKTLKSVCGSTHQCLQHVGCGGWKIGSRV